MKRALLMVPFYRWENWGPGKHLAWSRWQFRSRTRMQTQAIFCQRPPTTSLPSPSHSLNLLTSRLLTFTPSHIQKTNKCVLSQQGRNHRGWGLRESLLRVCQVFPLLLPSRPREVGVGWSWVVCWMYGVYSFMKGGPRPFNQLHGPAPLSRIR